MQPPEVPQNYRAYRPGDADVEWPRPEPLIGQKERQPYPVDALPAAIRRAVEEVQACVQAPVEMVAGSALATASLAAQALADVRRNHTLIGPIGLYFLTVAESGERKSTVDRLFGRAIHHFQDAQREAARTSLAVHTADLATWEARREASLCHLQGDAKANKPVDGHRADLAVIEAGKPVAPRVPRLLYADVTQERLMRSLATEWPSGGIFASEGAAVFGGHSMGRDSIARTLAALNTLWDGGTFLVDRAQAPSYAVRGARMTMALQVQPHVLSDFLERDRGLSRGSGFLARFLVAQPVSTQGRRPYRETEATPELDAFSTRIGEMLAELPSIDPERGLTPAVLDFSPDAKAHWIERYNAIESQLSSDGDFAAIPDVAAKAADNIARLAAVLHVFEHGAAGTISADTVHDAGEIVTWHLYSAKALLAPLSVSKVEANAASLDRWLLDRCAVEGVDGFSTRTLLQGGPPTTRKREDFDRAVALLMNHGRVRLAQDGKRQRLVVNPDLLDSPARPGADDGSDLECHEPAETRYSCYTRDEVPSHLQQV